MLLLRPRLVLLLIAAMLPHAAGAAADEDDPAERWMNAFLMLHAGNQLGERDLWPLALANYLTAMEDFRRLEAEHPEFQPELVAYRVRDLEERIERANESMNTGDHDIAMLYADFIETAGKGKDLRYAMRYEESYPYLVRARFQVEDLIDRRPDDLGPVLAEHRDHLDRLVDDIQDKLLAKADGAKLLNEIEKRFYLANAITLVELPEDPDVTVSADLFPASLTDRVGGRLSR